MDGPTYLRRLRSESILPRRMEGLLQVRVLEGREQGLHVGEAGPVGIWRCGHQGIQRGRSCFILRLRAQTSVFSRMTQVTSIHLSALIKPGRVPGRRRHVGRFWMECMLGNFMRASMQQPADWKEASRHLEIWEQGRALLWLILHPVEPR